MDEKQPMDGSSSSCFSFTLAEVVVAMYLGGMNECSGVRTLLESSFFGGV